jgi:hypothetical protein
MRNTTDALYTLSNGAAVYSGDDVSLRCNQNKIFGCGALATVPSVTFMLTPSVRTTMASGKCKCGLPVARTTRTIVEAKG